MTAKLQQLERIGLRVDCDTVYFGLLLKEFTTDDVPVFAMTQVEAAAPDDVPQPIADLAFRSGLRGDQIVDLLKEVVSPSEPSHLDFGGGVVLDECTPTWRVAGRKWRVLMLTRCLETEQERQRAAAREVPMQPIREGLWRRVGRTLCQWVEGNRQVDNVRCELDTIWATFLYPRDMWYLLGYITRKDPDAQKTPFRGGPEELLDAARPFLLDELADLRIQDCSNVTVDHSGL